MAGYIFKLTSVLVMLSGFSVFAAPVGWACFAKGKVYRVKTGGSVQALTGEVNAQHARWSVDGKLIFYILGNTEIWAMNNDGTAQRKIGTGKLPSGSPLAAYRPDSRCVLSVEGGGFYKLNADTKTKTFLGDCGQSVYGEIGISTDGRRLAFRSNGLHMMDVDAAGQKITNAFKYYGACSGGLSPDGNWATGNCGDHRCTLVFPWRSASSTSISCGGIGTNDNQTFAANSNDWICVLGDYGSGTNRGNEVGVINRATKEVGVVCSGLPFDIMYPDFFLGNLPSVTPPTPLLDVRNRLEAPRGPAQITVYDMSGRRLEVYTDRIFGQLTRSGIRGTNGSPSAWSVRVAVPETESLR